MKEGTERGSRSVHGMITHEQSISSRDYTRVCDLIYREAGIRLGAEKQTMLEGRLNRRLKVLNLESYGMYCDYLFGREGLREELVHLIDVVTTNKTDFFREPGHFDYLVEKALPDLTARNESGRPLLIWSAGCSTGEEPYTLAIVLSEYGLTHPGFRFKILATDISTTVLAKAELGVYSDGVVSPVLSALRRKYFMRSQDPSSDRVRVVPELRRLVEFRRLNFMDADFGIAEKADAIFCRNVIIYFDRPTQERILKKLSSHLAPRGYMFVGHAETLHDMDLPLVPVAPALYRRKDAGA
ncbi:MAG: protein-glutamate O-methyltransferase [Terracidiphilus sp.]|jgi:chemotaxis protein methyltransferase CheR